MILLTYSKHPVTQKYSVVCKPLWLLEGNTTIMSLGYIMNQSYYFCTLCWVVITKRFHSDTDGQQPYQFIGAKESVLYIRKLEFDSHRIGFVDTPTRIQFHGFGTSIIGQYGCCDIMWKCCYTFMLLRLCNWMFEVYMWSTIILLCVCWLVCL